MVISFLIPDIDLILSVHRCSCIAQLVQLQLFVKEIVAGTLLRKFTSPARSAEVKKDVGGSASERITVHRKGENLRHPLKYPNFPR